MNATLYAEKLRHVSPFLYKLAAQTWIDYDYPLHLFIETTAACNLTCSFCPRERRSNHMDFNLFTALIDEASRYGARSFSLHLFGEPTLYPKWQEAIAYIKERNARHTVLLTTNGTTLNQRVDDIIASKVDKVIWTWRPEVTFTPRTVDRLRRWGKFQVRLIEEITPKEEFEKWKHWRPIEIKTLHNYGANIDLSQFTSPDSDVNAAALKSTTRWPCYHLWLAPAVAWNGKILLCCADPHHEEVLGQFPSTSVHQAWTSPQLAAVRQSHMAGAYKGLCKNCDVWKTYPDLWFNFQKSSS